MIRSIQITQKKKERPTNEQCQKPQFQRLFETKTKPIYLNTKCVIKIKLWIIKALPKEVNTETRRKSLPKNLSFAKCECDCCGHVPFLLLRAATTLCRKLFCNNGNKCVEFIYKVKKRKTRNRFHKIYDINWGSKNLWKMLLVYNLQTQKTVLFIYECQQKCGDLPLRCEGCVRKGFTMKYKLYYMV